MASAILRAVNRRLLASSFVGLFASGCLLDLDGLTGGVRASGGAGASGAAGMSAGSAGGAAKAGASGSGGAGTSGAAGQGGVAGAAGLGGGGVGGAGKAGATSGGSSGASAGSSGNASGGTAGAGSAGAAGSAGVAGCADTTSDPKNCGACGRDCLGGACAQGQCAPVEVWSAGGVDGGAGVTSIALDAQNVYWTSSTRLYRQSIDASTGAMTDLGGVDAARAMTTAGGRLFIAAKSQLDGCDLPNCSSRSPLGNGTPMGVVADAGSVYWTDQGTPPNLTDGGVYRCGLFGCGSPTLLTVSKNEWNPAGITLAGGSLYFVDRAEPTTASGLVRRIPAAGPGVAASDPIAGPSTAPLLVVAHGGKLYWTEGGAKSDLLLCDPASCSPSPVVPSGTSPYPIIDSRGLAVDAGGVVWSNNAASVSASTVMSCPFPACTGAPRIVKNGLVKPGPVAANATVVFFGDATKAGTLWRWVR